MPQKNIQVDEGGNVIKRDNALDVGGDILEQIACMMEEVRDHVVLQTELLKELAK